MPQTQCLLKVKKNMDTPKEDYFNFTTSLKILVIEDNKVDCRLLESMLKDPSVVLPTILKITNTLAKAKKLLSEIDFDVIILDLNIDDSRGEKTLLDLQKCCPEIPIVVNTGAFEEDVGIKTLSLGAQDFLVKGRYSAYMLNKVLRYSVERKRLEKQLKQSDQDLKETQNQLAQSEKMKVIGCLASGVAHEVKNPLATIMYGATYLIEQNCGKDNDNYRTVLENIKEASERANGIINDLLDFSSLTKINKELCSVNDIISKSLVLTKHEFKRKRIEIDQKIDKILPEISADKNKLIQVLVNIILNAVYATPEQGTISINAHTAVMKKAVQKKYIIPENVFVDDTRLILLTIEDTGRGINPEDLDKIFDPFFTTRRAKGGVGLGLSVSKNIIKIHGGFINVDNKPDGSGAQAIIALIAPE